MCSPATAVSQIPCRAGETPHGPFPGSVGSSPGGCRQSCEASARLWRDAQRGCFPSNLTEKLQWMATCFCERFARNFAVSPDRLCIALFSNHSDSLAQQIPAPNFCAWHALGPVLLCVLSPLPSSSSKSGEFGALITLQGHGRILGGNLTFGGWCVWAGGARGGAQWSLRPHPLGHRSAHTASC